MSLRGSMMRQRDSIILRLYTKSMPDLNWECRELREEVYKIIEWWADKGVAGFRMDTINTIGKDQEISGCAGGCA